MKLKFGDIVASTATSTFATKPPNRKENQTLKKCQSNWSVFFSPEQIANCDFGEM
jgi:hypothetical protein